MDNNYSGETAFLRDEFLNSEVDYLKQLINVPEFFELYGEYRGLGTSALSQRLVALSTLMESGQIKEEDEGKIELEMICCCLAIEDALKTKGPKVLTPEPTEEITNGRTL